MLHSANNTRLTLYRQTLVCRVFFVEPSAKTLPSAQKTLGKQFFRKNKKTSRRLLLAAPPPRRTTTMPRHHAQAATTPGPDPASSCATVVGSVRAGARSGGGGGGAPSVDPPLAQGEGGRSTAAQGEAGGVPPCRERKGEGATASKGRGRAPPRWERAGRRRAGRGGPHARSVRPRRG